MGRNNYKYDDAKANKPFVTRLRTLCPENDRQIQTELGNHLGVTRQCVSNWIQGTVKPKEFDTLVRIAQFFNVTVDWLLGMPNASKEINADKYQVMKTTGLSETAVDHLISASAEHTHAVNCLLSVDDFTTAMSDLDEAIHLSQNWSCDSYYLIPAYTEQPTVKDVENDLQRRSDGFPTIIQINEIVRHLISYAFDEIEGQVMRKTLCNIYSIMSDDWNAEKERSESNGNDHGTEE